MPEHGHLAFRGAFTSPNDRIAYVFRSPRCSVEVIHQVYAVSRELGAPSILLVYRYVGRVASQEVQQAMATLAFADPQKSDIREYQQLFAPGRWDELASLFLQANEQVYSCGEQAPVLYALLAGLSVLKTPCCSDPSQRNPNCPVCSVAGHKLADSLPFGHHSQSHLVCRISGEVMDDNNPPLALPNGEVYSQSALQAQAAAGGGYVSCPRTGERFRLEAARTAYII